VSSELRVARWGLRGIISFESLVLSFELDEIPTPLGTSCAGMAICNGLRV
jgi:hypothetical protein